MEEINQEGAPAPLSGEPAQPGPSAEDVGQLGLQKSKKGLFVFFFLAVLIGGWFLAVWAYNEITLQKPLDEVLTSDSRNGVVVAKAHFDGWIDTQSVVFDISDVSEHSSQMDVFRVFLQYAKAQKEHRYKQIILAGYGQKKFILAGDYFHELGTEYDTQNPMYTIRIFAHHITTIEGNHPFYEYDGGLFAVLTKEMEQFSDFNKQWYLNEYVARHK
jgi:hypothetical protein